MMWTTNDSTGDKSWSTQVENLDAPCVAGGANGGRSIENLSTVLKLTKSKKLDLPKANFAKVNSSGPDFLTPKAKKVFIHLWKAFTKTLILRYFDSEYHIRIETNALGYSINEVLSQMTSDQHFSSHVTNEDPNSSKSEIGQWHLIAFFSQKMIPVETWYQTNN